MVWRDEVSDLAAMGDVEGVLDRFDEVWADREQVRQRAEAYLAEIIALKGGKPVARVSTEDVLNRLTAEIRRYTASR